MLLSPELFRADGGIARIMRVYLKALCEICGADGHVDSLVLNDSPGGDRRLERYSNQRLNRHVSCVGRKLRFLTQAIKLGRQSDILICGHLHHLPIARLAQFFNPRLRYFLVAHGIEVWRPYNALERRALLRAHRILCVSEFTRRQMLRFLPTLPVTKIVVVPNALDPYFARNSNPAFAGSLFAVPRILTVSRLTRADNYKGVDTLIEAMPRVRREYPIARLRVVGQGDDLPRLQTLAATLGMSEAVDFTGQVDDETLRAEYETCDLFALPSRKEGFGLVYLEAMASGKACIGARAGGAPEVIDPTVGQLVDYGNIPNLATAIVELTRHPRDSEIVRQHAAAFAFPVFQQRLAAALN
ncbi:MAG TPA: glycosyltransferase family 4 protein [Lacunisphaera sp.]